MSRSSVAAKHLRAALSRWPQDTLRPETQLPKALARRFELLDARSGNTAVASSTLPTESAALAAADGAYELRQANALYALLDNRFKNRYRVKPELYKPLSRPTYYDELIKELDEVPTRSIWSRLVNHIKGMVRLQ